MSEIGSVGTQQSGAGAPGSTGELVGATGDAHASAAQRYEKIREAEGRISVAREIMDSLAAMKDTVTQDDVVKAAGRMVAAGGDAPATAGLLAEMPPDGEALAGWIQQKDQGLRQLEALLEEKMSEARHQMGVSALQHIAATQAHQQFGAPVPAPASGNALLSAVPSGGAPNV